MGERKELRRETLARLVKAAVANRTEVCVEWPHAVSALGYGCVGNGPKAHCCAYVIAKGPIPKGLFVCHSCDNRRCINPAHLWLGTHNDNMADMSRKGRAGGGDGAHSRKLTVEKVKAILADRRNNQAIADTYGVSRPVISEIKRGLRWRRVHRELATRGEDAATAPTDRLHLRECA
jgi:hypothetical protein